MDLVDDSCARQQCRKKVYFSNKIIKKNREKKLKVKATQKRTNTREPLVFGVEKFTCVQN